jgi:hypothetical protein
MSVGRISKADNAAIALRMSLDRPMSPNLAGLYSPRFVAGEKSPFHSLTLLDQPADAIKVEAAFVGIDLTQT